MSRKIEQKLILTTSIGKDGNLEIKLDFYPKMPTIEEYKNLPQAKQGVVAVINKFATINKMAIKEMLELNSTETIDG